MTARQPSDTPSTRLSYHPATPQQNAKTIAKQGQPRPQTLLDTKQVVFLFLQAALLLALSMVSTTHSNMGRITQQQEEGNDNRIPLLDLYEEEYRQPSSTTSSLYTRNNIIDTTTTTTKSHHTPTTAESSSSSSSLNLEIAWLMSFPNSGTSYTLHLVRTASQTQTATNYATKRLQRKIHRRRQESSNATTTPTKNSAITVSRPVFPHSQPMGPFWGGEEDEYSNLALPSHVALTKTHCATPCIWCGPDKYLISTHFFQSRCQRAERIVLSDSHDTTKNTTNNTPTALVPTIEKAVYPTTHVTKAIHLFRNPLDNVVSRFRYERSNGRSATAYPDTREGFRSYCHTLNQEFRSHYRTPGMRLLLDPTLLRLLEQVPCFSELIRYVEWHNMAWATQWDLNLETLVLHYSDYRAPLFQSTLDRLLTFLQLQHVGSPAVFVESKTYGHYYTWQEQMAAFAAMKQMSFQHTWEQLERYVPTHDSVEETIE